jgi:branched-chain amino acid transport system ATP-binding protein
MSEKLLSAVGVTSGYNGVPVLRGFDLDLSAGEVVALLGPNGAGKTTALHTLVGLVPATCGSISALGIKVTSRSTARLARTGVVLVPDDRGVFGELTVAEHFRIAGSAAKSRLETVLELFPALPRLLRRKVSLLSGGEQQMVALAKSLLMRPRVLMVDELSLGLAPVIITELLPAVRAIAKAEGIGVLLVEQHLTIALSVADRALVLNQGRIVLEDAAAVLAADTARVESAYFTTDGGRAS